MVNQKILGAVKEARGSTKRNFKQTFDIAVNLKNIDMKKNESKIKIEINVPHIPGNKAKIGIIVDSMATGFKDREDVKIINKAELEKLGEDRKLAKKTIKDCSYFIAEAPLMPLVGKSLGSILAPRNMMPRPVPPSAKLDPIIEQAKRTIRVQLKESPVFHLGIGNEDMEDEKIAENIFAAVERILSSLPKGKEQIKNIVVKTTMGKPVKYKV